MIYRGEELANYPICDTDIWVYAILGNLEEQLIDRYGKIVVADVVEKEILWFVGNSNFKQIAEKFKIYKENGNIIVIEHSSIEKEDKLFLERQLIDCDHRFKTGLGDRPHEEHKGEIVSAIYAEYFECPFLKSNDNAFRDGNMGEVAFPDLIVKNLRDMLNDLVEDKQERWKYRQRISDNQALLNEGTRINKEEKNKEVTQDDIDKLLLKWKGNR